LDESKEMTTRYRRNAEARDIRNALPHGDGRRGPRTGTDAKTNESQPERVSVGRTLTALNEGPIF